MWPSPNSHFSFVCWWDSHNNNFKEVLCNWAVFRGDAGEGRMPCEFWETRRARRILYGTGWAMDDHDTFLSSHRFAYLWLFYKLSGLKQQCIIISHGSVGWWDSAGLFSSGDSPMDVVGNWLIRVNIQGLTSKMASSHGWHWFCLSGLRTGVRPCGLGFLIA